MEKALDLINDQTEKILKLFMEAEDKPTYALELVKAILNLDGKITDEQKHEIGKLARDDQFVGDFLGVITKCANDNAIPVPVHLLSMGMFFPAPSYNNLDEEESTDEESTDEEFHTIYPVEFNGPFRRDHYDNE